jgi:hypothetical protein
MRVFGAGFWLAALLASGIGCRGLLHRAPSDAESRAPAQQLVFDCDFDLPTNDPLVRELIAERNDVAATLDLPASDEPITVHLYRDEKEYGRVLAERFPSVPSRRAFFVETDTRLEVYAHWSERVAEDLRHEVAHGYLHAMVPALPLWLDEGLAEYFEVPRGHGGLNRPHAVLLAEMIQLDGWRPDLVRLERLSSAGELEQADYAEAWGWVYFLLESDAARRELLTTYLADLRERGRVEPLSVRLASHHVEPERTLAEFLATLQVDSAIADRRLR